MCSASDLFNMITDRDIKLAESWKIIKNMDDFFLYGDTIEQLEEQVVKLLEFCRKINVKLSPRKFKVNTMVKFNGMMVSSEQIKKESFVLN